MQRSTVGPVNGTHAGPRLTLYAPALSHLEAAPETFSQRFYHDTSFLKKGSNL
jgi:hypothetical protein